MKPSKTSLFSAAKHWTVFHRRAKRFPAEIIARLEALRSRR
jgi:hypothetical protein